MIHDKKTAASEGQRIANENCAPVWINFDLICRAYMIHETPPPDYVNWDNIWIIPPKDERGKV
jgi:hypothetical protein